MSLSLRCLFAIVLCTGAVHGADRAGPADLPLGTVTQVADEAVVCTFDRGAGLAPDDMLALYGPGSVTKHPLTGEVTVERRQLVGKAQVLAVRGGTVRTRVTWRAEAVALEPGFDAVPMPDTASPDAPPVLTAAIESVSVEAQASARIALPVVDPEGEPLAVRWDAAAADGHRGRLSARTTVRPVVSWTAPAVPGTVTLRATVADAAGQVVSVEQPVTVTEPGDDWRRRTLTGAAAFGGDDLPSWRHLARDADGAWWAISDRDAVYRIAPGWNGHAALAVQDGVRLSSPVAVVPRGDELWILDDRQRTVHVLAADGVLRRSVGAFEAPTDLVLDRDGACYVADQRAGGVVVHEPDGSFRLRLGRPGDPEQPDAFAGLTRLAIDREGTLYCLDADAFRIQRFDRFHRRLPAWSIQGDRETAPVDCAVHPRGLLVLMADGTIQVFDAEGVAGEILRPMSESGWFEGLDAPSAVRVDGTGTILVTYPEDGLVARYDAEGRFDGVRGAALWDADRIAADGQGRLFALDDSTGLIRMFDVEGWMVARFGGTERYGGPFEEPGAMVASLDGRHLFVLDTDRVTVLRFDLARPADRPFVFGQRGENPGQFEEPVDLAVDAAGRCYVLDPDLHRFAVFDADGGFLFNVGHYERGRGSDELDEPTLIAVTAAGDAAYVYDEDRYEVMKFALDQDARTGAHVSNAGGRGRELGQFYRPAGMACDRFGLLYVLDARRYDLQAIDFTGSNAVTLHALELETVGMRRPERMALSPDGIPWAATDERVIGLRWIRE